MPVVNCHCGNFIAPQNGPEPKFLYQIPLHCLSGKKVVRFCCKRFKPALCITYPGTASTRISPFEITEAEPAAQRIVNSLQRSNSNYHTGAALTRAAGNASAICAGGVAMSASVNSTNSPCAASMPSCTSRPLPTLVSGVSTVLEAKFLACVLAMFAVCQNLGPPTQR